MNQMSLWKKILAVVILVLILASAVVLIIHFSSKTDDTGKKNTTEVLFGPLSSNLSSNGTLQKIGTDIDVPLAAAISGDVLTSGTEEGARRSLFQALINNNGDEPLLYRVDSVNEKYTEGAVTLSSSDASETIMVLKPVTIDYTAASLAQQAAFIAETTNAETLIDFLLDRETGYLKVQNFSSDFMKEETDESKWVTISTGSITARLQDSMKNLDSFTYTLSGITANEDDYFKINDEVMHLSYQEWFTVFTLSEYDVAPINKRMNEGEKVYAAVGINALSPVKVVAEITEIKSAGNVSGVSYFSLYARLIFPKIVKDENENDVGDYSYYSEDLDERTVENLGVVLSTNVEKSELLTGYSVTITAQKSVVVNQLIVPTKCIYYNDANEPYVLVVSEDGKESRVYIEIVLSTGKDAAVKPAAGYDLHENDCIRYPAEESLLSSLF